MKFRILVWLLLVALMACGLFAAETLLEQRQLASKTVRLHVVANSDSEEDQAQKLRVRDAVLECVGTLTADCKDAAAARALLADGAPDLAILDIMLPGEDGFSLAETMIEREIPVLFLTAKTAVNDRVRGLPAQGRQRRLLF